MAGVSRRAPDDAGTSDAPPAAITCLRTPLIHLQGVGPRRAARLARHGLLTVGDLLFHLPFRYEDRRTLTPVAALVPGTKATIVAEIVRVREGRLRRRREGGGRRGYPGGFLEALARDETGAVTLVWFQKTGYFRTRATNGARVVIHGRVEPGPKLFHPEIEILPDARGGPGSSPRGNPPSAEGLAPDGADGGWPGDIVPVYGKPTGMPAGLMRRLVRMALSGFGGQLRGAIPCEIARRHGLMDLGDALAYLHEPPRDADVDALMDASSAAHRTVIFDELLCLQIGLGLRRAAGSRAVGFACRLPGRRAETVRQHLPFALTRAQERVLEEIYADMATARPMHRVVQGEVGSGKTVVALFAALAAIDAGCSAAVMAPTEVLAEQHAETFRALLAPVGLQPRLLTGSMEQEERVAVLAALAADEPVLVVGTHALIQKTVRFSRLGLAVIDEQHRFGVVQRALLAGRAGGGEGGERPFPHALVMTATPIPRTLAMTVYGDLDVSYLDELPAGRQPVTTRVVAERDRDRAYACVREEVARGRQAFIVFPVVDDADDSRLRAAIAMAKELQATTFAGYRVGLIHGRMAGERKEEAMRRFKTGGTQILVCTTVIEVGIDVPNATAMVIEHADRFGLAQLHQLRGRVGRGSEAATCYMILSSTVPGDRQERLRVMEETRDGLSVAEADLRLRGPGEFLGTRQAGLPELRVASLLRDTALLVAAREEAERVLRDGAADPDALSAARAALARYRWVDELGLG